MTVYEVTYANGTTSRLLIDSDDVKAWKAMPDVVKMVAVRETSSAAADKEGSAST